MLVFPLSTTHCDMPIIVMLTAFFLHAILYWGRSTLRFSFSQNKINIPQHVGSEVLKCFWPTRQSGWPTIIADMEEKVKNIFRDKRPSTLRRTYRFTSWPCTITSGKWNYANKGWHSSEMMTSKRMKQHETEEKMRTKNEINRTQTKNEVETNSKSPYRWEFLFYFPFISTLSLRERTTFTRNGSKLISALILRTFFFFCKLRKKHANMSAKFKSSTGLN